MSQLLAKLLDAKALSDSGKHADAARALQALAAKHPAEPDVVSLLAVTLYQMRQYERALFYAKRAADLRPQDASYHTNLALVQDATGKREAAEASLHRAIAINPAHPDARLSLANRALDEHRTRDAAAHCEAVLKVGLHPQVAMTYCGALMAMGEVEKAVDFTRIALEKYPRDASLWGGLCAGLNYLYGASVAECSNAHRRYGELLAEYRPAEKFTYRGTRDAGRRLKVGFVSNDLRTHSVSFFMEPFFDLHDRSKFEVHAFSTSRHPDATSERLKKMVARWHECGDLIDIEIARLVEKQGIDILVDLSGHTLNSQLTAMSYKAAPVQATYCGYPNTTGLKEIDYRIVDGWTDPLREARSGAAMEPDHPDFDERCTETLVRIDPCFLCYQPPRDAPTPSREAGGAGPVFGSFNANKKIGAGVIALWSRVLKGVEGSRLIMKTFELKDPDAKARVYREFGACGIAPERVEIMEPTKGIAEHLAKYALVDVALDSLPYNGTTTTCEALWMGVPVVALAGATHAARVGVSLLNAVGVPELIATSEDAYVTLAADLARDPARLAHYRATLRDRVAVSPLCDRVEFCARFSDALRGMWTRWCAR